MRILIVSDAWEPQVNGVVRTYQNIGRALQAMGHSVTVIGPSQFSSMPMPGYPEIRLTLFPYRRLSHMIRDHKADHVHVAVEGPLGWAARRYCMTHDIPFSTSFHTQFPDYVATHLRYLGPRVTAFMRRMAIKWVRGFHAPAHHMFVATQSLEDQLKAWDFRVPMRRLVRGADMSVFQPDGPRLFENAAKPVMVYVGRVSSEKNIEAFLDSPLPGTKVVVGHGPQLDSLKARYPDVTFTGMQTGAALGAHFRSADVFVFPSLTDTFGMVVIEALACGVPVAAYDVTGPRDIVTEPMLGAVDAVLDRAITRALDAPGDRAARSAYVRQHYDWQKVAEAFIAA